MWEGNIMERMRRTLTLAIYISSLLAAVLLWPIPLLATNYTVKAGGGGNYTTIQACANAMAAGDTCTVFAGTYNENVTVSAGGVGAYKTLTVNSSDVVSVFSFTINSHVKIVGNCTAPAGTGTCGFNIQHPSSPSTNPCVSVVANSTDFYITNNVMYACAQFVKEASNANTTHGFIQGNTMSWSYTTSSAPLSQFGGVGLAGTINGDYHLLENNDISHVSDGFYLHGAHIYLRKNTLHDTNETTECLVGGNGGNCHIDFMQADTQVPGGQPTQYLVLEGNTAKNMVGSNEHAVGLLQAEACNGQCFNGIVRFHVAAHIGGGAIIDDNSFVNPPPQAWINVKSYNNTWLDMAISSRVNGAATNGFAHGSFGGSDINSIFHYVGSLGDFNPDFCLDTACSPFKYGYNLAFCTVSCGTLRPHTYSTGAWTDDPGNILADPKFVNYAGDDFHLQASSPAIGGGTNLTTTTNSGTSSTTLTVADANYFQDGAGIAGVQPDCLRIGGTTTVCITSGGVNYSTNTITLSAPATWSNGAAVYLYSDSQGIVRLTGANPDIGAYPYSASSGGSPGPPTQLAVVSIH
jgi:hypothetical protein